MEKDIRRSALYQEAATLCSALRQPSTGLLSDATEVSTNGTDIAFAGTLVDSLTGSPPTRVCLTREATGHTHVLTFGPNSDRLPKFSPDGQQIAFLSDRLKAGDFQLYLLDLASGAAKATPRVEGWVEYLHWSPDGKRILLGVAGHGADVSGGQGAISSEQIPSELPSWMPTVETGDESYRWRCVWIYELESERVFRAGTAEANIWEAVWCGNTAFAAVSSPSPGEGSWYTARLHLFDIVSSRSRELYTPRHQLGWPAASPSGAQLSIVEAICSDRWLVAGELLLIDTASGEVHRPDTQGVDITYTEWRSDTHLLLAGHHGFESVVALLDASSAEFTEVWRSQEITTGGRYMTVSGCGPGGDCALIGEGFTRAPEIAVIRGGTYRTVKSLDVGYADQIRAIEAVETVRWNATDGLEIQGWLLRPRDRTPHPLIMYIHGGPVSHSRPVWLGRRGALVLLLLRRGYAVFFPNPRGSSGRGQNFVRHVVGDMGGEDGKDCLAGIDHLIERGIADPARLGVTGASYGGFMTAWLITQDPRFAAAVPVAPVTNHVTEHLISNIPHFVSLFLADSYMNPNGAYFSRSPVMHAHRVRTPTLSICGARDSCTPPEEAVQFHRALLESGVRTVLVTYPEEGHGIRKFPAAIDYSARVAAWFEEHMPPNRK